MNQKWGIVGLGWLGNELATRLAQSGFEYWGTHRSSFDWERDDFPLTSCDVLFLNTPPLNHITPKDFVEKVPPQKGRIIFISSIGVYGEVYGTITEKTIPRPNTTNGIWLYEVEKMLLDKFKDQITIIRAGGLIGGNRHPVFSLAIKPEMVIPEGIINLIHRNDLISIIMAISTIDKSLPLLNAVAPYHPLKSEYYSLWANKHGFGLLRFSKESENRKIVQSEVLDTIYSNWHCPELDVL